MSRPPLEVADLIRVAGQQFIEASRRWITGQHLKVLAAIERCRTAALGGHRDRCVPLRVSCHSFNSCRNRHCPKCQAPARDRWLRARRRELLPTPYVHVVFTLPRRLAPLALQNKKVIYDLLFRTCAETLLEIARDPRHLGAEIGFFSVLHSWNQKLEHHPHVHCVVPAGGLSPDHQRWIPSRYRFFLPVKVLGRVFRGKFVAALRRAFDDGQLGFYGDSSFWRKRRLSLLSSAPSSVRTGWSTASRPSVVPNTFSVISAATPTAWRSPITAWSPWRATKSPSAGETPRTATSSV